MSELAYNQHGDRFEVPPQAAYWRVRRFKAPGTRGAPEVVYGSDGTPLSVPIDSSMPEFREAVDGVTGRYRLDPIDELGAAAGDAAAYIQVREVSRKEIKPSMAEASDPQADLIRELIRANTEMTRTITEKFAQVMESAAVLIRAADGAGIAARKPVEAPAPAQQALPPAARRNAALDDDDDDDDDDEEEEADAPSSVLASVLQMALEKAMPLISHAIHTKVMGLSSAQSMALLGNVTPPPAQTGSSTTPAVTDSAEAANDPSVDTEHDDAFVDEPSAEVEVEVERERERQAKSSRRATAPTSNHSAKKTAEGRPMAFVTHLAAIESHLSAADIDAIKTLISVLSPTELVEWKERLMQASPAEAAALIVAEVTARQTKGRDP